MPNARKACAAIIIGAIAITGGIMTATTLTVITIITAFRSDLQAVIPILSEHPLVFTAVLNSQISPMCATAPAIRRATMRAIRHATAPATQHATTPATRRAFQEAEDDNKFKYISFTDLRFI